MKKLKVLDLFSGIGGFTLGLDSTNFFETVKFVEKDKYCQKVLQKNFPNIPIEEDIKNVKGKEGEADVICGGFPCQPFSVAGKQKGTSDDRHLWPEMFRLIREIKPQFVIGENVKNIINIQDGVVFETVCTDLESEGYEVQPFIIPAAGVGAPHRRERVWIIANREESMVNPDNIRLKQHNEAEKTTSWRGTSATSESTSSTNVAYAERNGQFASKEREGIKETISKKQKGSNHSFDTERASYISTTKTNVANTKSIESYVGEHGKHQEERSGQGEIRGENSHDANTYSKRLERFRTEHELRNSEKEKQTSGNSWWSVEPNVGRVANGVPGRVHRLKGLGNAIVPQIAKEIGLAIKKVINDI
jgi:DNA (cytosine-5)-methyltransferase 1